MPKVMCSPVEGTHLIKCVALSSAAPKSVAYFLAQTAHASMYACVYVRMCELCFCAEQTPLGAAHSK